MLLGHPIFWILVAAVLAPLLAEIPLGFKVPVVVLEVVLGIVIGPHVLGLARAEGILQERLPDMRLGDRITLGRLATPAVLRSLLGDAERKVTRSALFNPRLRESDLVAALHGTPAMSLIEESLRAWDRVDIRPPQRHAGQFIRPGRSTQGPRRIGMQSAERFARRVTRPAAP